MSSFSFDSFVNSSVINILTVYSDDVVTYLSNIYEKIKQGDTYFTVIESLPDSLHFDDFQWVLFKIFSSIFVINLILIFIAWKIFGHNICERFMKTATSKAIEELKASVSRLKLPKEHTPRI